MSKKISLDGPEASQFECNLIRNEIMQKLEYRYKIRAVMYSTTAILTGYLYAAQSDYPEFFLIQLFIIFACYIESVDAIKSIYKLSSYLSVFHNDVFKWESRLQKLHAKYGVQVKKIYTQNLNKSPFLFASSFCISNYFVYSFLKEKQIYGGILILFIFILLYFFNRNLLYIKPHFEQINEYEKMWKTIKDIEEKD